ncbi:MAG: hypothetical protein M0R06_20320 [Sphaerochaeta sp.]|jgi:hypothetical protein|nr:hypothetical protein [Sphaerochaeta sp.]
MLYIITAVVLIMLVAKFARKFVRAVKLLGKLFAWGSVVYCSGIVAAIAINLLAGWPALTYAMLSWVGVYHLLLNIIVIY